MLSTEGIGIDKRKSMLDILGTFLAGLVCLCVEVSATTDSLVNHWQTDNGANATGYLTALVVASLPLTIPCQRKGHDSRDTIEESDGHELCSNQNAQLKTILGMVVVFHLLDDVRAFGVGIIEEKG